MLGGRKKAADLPIWRGSGTFWSMRFGFNGYGLLASFSNPGRNHFASEFRGRNQARGEFPPTNREDRVRAPAGYRRIHPACFPETA